MYNKNLITFVQGIDSDNLPVSISHHFDEVTVLYRLIGGRSDVDICTNEKGNNFGFSILTEQEEVANKIHNLLNKNNFVVYGKSLTAYCKREKNDCLNVRFK